MQLAETIGSIDIVAISNDVVLKLFVPFISIRMS